MKLFYKGNSVIVASMIKTKFRDFSPQANHTDRAIATCRYYQIESVAWSAQRIPTAVSLGFLDPELLLFHSSNCSIILTRLTGPRSRPTSSQKIW
jgi:hypothetical protein